MDSKNHTSTEILEPGPVILPGECREFLQRYQELLNDCSVVTASGSLPKGVPTDFYRQLIELAGDWQIHFLLDTSGEPLEQGIRSKPYLIKPNLEEAQKLLGTDLTTLQDQAEAVFRLQRQGIPRPCLTLGKDGCVAGLPDGIYHLYGPPLEVVNTVGSGDSFIAGCAVGLARRMAPLDVIKYGMASAMANTQFFQTGMVSLELVSRFLGEIQCQIIEEVSLK